MTDEDMISEGYSSYEEKCKVHDNNYLHNGDECIDDSPKGYTYEVKNFRVGDYVEIVIPQDYDGGIEYNSLNGETAFVASKETYGYTLELPDNGNIFYFYDFLLKRVPFEGRYKLIYDYDYFAFERKLNRFLKYNPDFKPCDLTKSHLGLFFGGNLGNYVLLGRTEKHNGFCEVK